VFEAKSESESESGSDSDSDSGSDSEPEEPEAKSVAQPRCKKGGEKGKRIGWLEEASEMDDGDLRTMMAKSMNVSESYDVRGDVVAMRVFRGTLTPFVKPKSGKSGLLAISTISI
jgi:hypothetical protein